MCSSRVTYIEISVQRSILLLQIYLRTLAIVLIMICSSVVLRNVTDFCYQYDNELNIYKNQQELHCFCFHYENKKKKDYYIHSFCCHYENLGSAACLGGIMGLFGIFGYIEFV